MKKVISLLLCIVTVATLCFGLAACNNTETDEGTPVVFEDDAYDMANVGESIGQKILDTALSGVGSGVTSGVSKVVSSVASWAAEGIIKSLGFDYYGEDSYKKEVLDRLEDLNVSITKLEGKVDWLTKAYADQKYYDKYTAFNTAYKALSASIYTPYNYLTIVEKNLELGTEKNLESDLDSICQQVKGNTGTSKSQLHTELESFADNYFISSSVSSVTELQELSIFKIADKFVQEFTAYAENRYKQVEEMVSYPYSAFYVGLSLVVLDYTRTLEQNGVTQYWLDDQGNLIGYEIQEAVEGTEQYKTTAYWNCTSLEKDKYVEKYGELVKGTALEKAEAMTINNAPNGGVLQPTALNLTSAIAKYYKVNELYNNFMDKYAVNNEEGKLTFTELGQKATVNVSTVWARDILSVDKIGGDGTIKINYDAFGNIHKSDFEKFASTILPYSYELNSDGSKKKLTFREFFEKEGFNFPTNKSTKYLILGAQKGLSDRDQYINNGYKYTKCIAVVSVNLDTVVEDFVNNKSYEYIYYAMYCSKVSVPSTCGPKFRENWYFVEGKTVGRDYMNTLLFSTQDLSTWKNKLFSSPTEYLTIKGLSWNPAKGVQSVGNTF